MVYSEFYEKEMDISGIEDTLLDIYEKVAANEDFSPDYDDRKLVDLHENPSLLDTILHHVESCGKTIQGYDEVRYLFEEKSIEEKTTTITVATPLGDIVVTSKNDPEYPGVWIDLKGDNVRDTFEKGAVSLAMVEYHPDSTNIRAVLYADCDKEEPTNTIEFPNTQKLRIKELVSEKVEEIFSDLQKKLHIDSGDIDPFDAVRLEDLENELACHIETVLKQQGCM